MHIAKIPIFLEKIEKIEKSIVVLLNYITFLLIRA